MEVSLSSLPKSVSASPLLSRPRCLVKPLCSLGAPFPKIPLRSFSFSLSSTSISTRPPLHSNPLLTNFASLSLSTTAVSAGGGGGDALPGGGGSGGGGGAGGGGESQTKSIALEEALSQSSDVIVLYVGGMTCGGCAASVKRILESQPQVSTATVYLENETAVVWPVEEVKSAEDWQKQLGEKLANHLSTCGFKSHLRVCFLPEAPLEGVMIRGLPIESLPIRVVSERFDLNVGQWNSGSGGWIGWIDISRKKEIGVVASNSNLNFPITSNQPAPCSNPS
ncbi:copper-transporting ATPase PAA1 [Carex littledalei]|uniref:Copper-transporting ATPase PAA1 n=1 Tax=Carex littledalei TaxID=544730 RepID=A0A833QL14_9POAL|nr:copper-transporting ATPase PAA1 [Carex littledalei]